MNFRFAEGITDEMFPFLTEKNHVVSLVGAGGKTTLLYALAEYLRAKGWRVLVTTTTHIWQPTIEDICAGADVLGKNCLSDASAKKESEPDVFGKSCLSDTSAKKEIASDALDENGLSDASAKKEIDPDALDKKGRAWVTDRAGVHDCWARGAYAVLGLPSEKGKLGPAPEAELLPLLAEADCVLIEADGAKRKPCKVPASHEPVIRPECDTVIGVVGIDALGRPLQDVCFRAKEAASLLNVSPEHRLTDADLVRILLSEQGTKKSVRGRSYEIVINKCDTLREIRQGERLRAQLLLGGARRVTLAGNFMG